MGLNSKTASIFVLKAAGSDQDFAQTFKAQTFSLIQSFAKINAKEVLAKDTRGKPSLTKQIKDKLGPWEISITHTDEIGAIAFAHNNSIGLDIENCLYQRDWEKLRDRVFTATENKQLNQHLPTCGYNLFNQLWTVKESYLKMTGMGLANQLLKTNFEFSIGKKKELQVRSADCFFSYLPLPDPWVGSLASQKPLHSEPEIFWL